MKNTVDKLFLEGAQNHWQDIVRTVGISREFMRGFKLLRNIGPCVTVFGSSRFTEDHPYYQLGVAVGAALGEAGFTIMTGGGPGIMEAANRGAQQVGALSVGCNIQLPAEQQPNKFLDLQTEFQHFFVRKVMLVKFSCAFVVLPGGFGTMDEIFETLNLIETKKIQDFPLVIMGEEYWQEMDDFIRTKMLNEKTISGSDADRLFMTNSPEQMIDYINAHIGPCNKPMCSETELP
jgi:uncharacterized protein (TIGR00730 family)